MGPTLISVLVLTVHDLVVVRPLINSDSALRVVGDALCALGISSRGDPNIEHIVLGGNESDALAVWRDARLQTGGVAEDGLSWDKSGNSHHLVRSRGWVAEKKKNIGTVGAFISLKPCHLTTGASRILTEETLGRHRRASRFRVWRTCQLLGMADSATLPRRLSSLQIERHLAKKSLKSPNRTPRVGGRARDVQSVPTFPRSAQSTAFPTSC